MLDLTPWLVSGGLVGCLTILARVFLALHRSAVTAHEKRADDQRARAEAAEARADLREEQIAILLGEHRGRDEVATPQGENGRRRRTAGGPGSAARGGKAADGGLQAPGAGGRRPAR